MRPFFDCPLFTLQNVQTPRARSPLRAAQGRSKPPISAILGCSGRIRSARPPNKTRWAKRPWRGSSLVLLAYIRTSWHQPLQSLTRRGRCRNRSLWSAAGCDSSFPRAMRTRLRTMPIPIHLPPGSRSIRTDMFIVDPDKTAISSAGSGREAVVSHAAASGAIRSPCARYYRHVGPSGPWPSSPTIEPHERG